MTFRITQKRLQNRFQALAGLMGWDITMPIWHPSADGKGSDAKVGTTFLEHNSVYGYSINRIVNRGGGETRLKESCSASEMDEWLSGALFVAYQLCKPVEVHVNGGVADSDDPRVVIIDHDNLEDDVA